MKDHEGSGKMVINGEGDDRGRGNGRTSFSRDRFGGGILEEKSGSPHLVYRNEKGPGGKSLERARICTANN
jgi:hypothetical protein